MADGILAGVREAVASVDDPEYPGISIVEMGMVGDCRVEHGRVHVRLVPTFTGCPALGFIEADVRAAVAAEDSIFSATPRSSAMTASRPASSAGGTRMSTSKPAPVMAASAVALIPISRPHEAAMRAIRRGRSANPPTARMLLRSMWPSRALITLAVSSATPSSTALARSARFSGSKSATAATVTLGWS